MNGYQRIKAALNGEWPDKRPVMLHNFMLAAREAGYTMKQYRDDPQIAAKVHIQTVEKYDLDGLLFDVDTALLASAIGIPTDYPVDEPARTHEPLLTSLEMLDDLSPVDISKNERIQAAIEAVRILKKYFGDEIFLRGNIDQAPFSLASMVRTPGDFMMDLLMNEEKVFQLLDYCLDPCLQFAQLMSEAGVHMLSNGDSPAGPEMISPDMYEKFALPYEKKIAEKSHQLGLPYLMHICGDTTSILKDMSGIGIDAIELDYKTDIQKIYDMYKDTITFFGNIDPSGVLANGTTKIVEEKVVELLKVYRDSPRFVMNAGCAIPPTTPEANIRTLIEITRN